MRLAIATAFCITLTVAAADTSSAIGGTTASAQDLCGEVRSYVDAAATHFEGMLGKASSSVDPLLQSYSSSTQPLAFTRCDVLEQKLPNRIRRDMTCRIEVGSSSAPSRATEEAVLRARGRVQTYVDKLSACLGEAAAHASQTPGIVHPDATESFWTWRVNLQGQQNHSPSIELLLYSSVPNVGALVLRGENEFEAFVRVGPATR